jgi:hypothetical protein
LLNGEGSGSKDGECCVELVGLSFFLSSRRPRRQSGLDSAVLTSFVRALALAEPLIVWEADVTVWDNVSIDRLVFGWSLLTLLPVLPDVTITLTPPHEWALGRVARVHCGLWRGQGRSRTGIASWRTRCGSDLGQQDGSLGRTAGRSRGVASRGAVGVCGEAWGGDGRGCQRRTAAARSGPLGCVGGERVVVSAAARHGEEWVCSDWVGWWWCVVGV